MSSSFLGFHMPTHPWGSFASLQHVPFLLGWEFGMQAFTVSLRRSRLLHYVKPSENHLNRLKEKIV
ncbi:hypothetical protein J14TS2_36240 [Bacillus sp. J14TS2]|nr:hypothetical protein J14TS2_36240 [Bacillus sp. J14TS2]